MPTLDEVIAYIETSYFREVDSLNPYEAEVVRAAIWYLKELKKFEGEE